MRHQIPDAALQHEAERTQLARIHFAAAAIGDAQEALAPQRRGDLRQERWRLRAAKPADGIQRKARRAALLAINDLAMLGNRLPPQTWLTRVHAGRDGTWAIEGRAGRIPEVGTTLAGLALIDPAARVRLVSLANPAERARAIRFSIAWDRTAP